MEKMKKWEEEFDDRRKRFHYSAKYEDDVYEYRHVHVPRDFAHMIPKRRLMKESEWRSLGVKQSLGWEHYMIHAPQPHILLFRRPLDYAATTKGTVLDTVEEEEMEEGEVEREEEPQPANVRPLKKTVRKNNKVANTRVPEDKEKKEEKKEGEKRKRKRAEDVNVEENTDQDKKPVRMTRSARNG